jgi:hypothetical protein
MILKIILKKRSLKLQAPSFKLQAARPGGPSKIVKKDLTMDPGDDRMSLERKKTYD